jgi:hypothetical protein
MLQKRKWCLTSTEWRGLFWESPLCEAQGSPFSFIVFFVFIARLNPFIVSMFMFSYSLGQIFLPTVRNTWYGVCHQKSSCELGIFDELVGSPNCSLISKHPGHFPKWNPGSQMYTTFMSVLTNQWLLGLSHHDWWWICHFLL